MTKYLVFCFWVYGFAALASSLSLEEKVGQVLMVHFRGSTANEEAQKLICDAHVGGFIYYNWANELSGADQIRALSESLQKMSRIPLLIAVDQEGGVVSRLKQDFVQFPGNMAIAKTKDLELCKLSAYCIGRQLQSVGVNFNLAPVVDINSNPHNPIIGVRSFGESSDEVIAFAEKALEGYLCSGVLSCLKHFPGHGDVTVDSHEALPWIYKTKEQLDSVELKPFKQLSTKADAVMTAHLMIPSLDETSCATLSPKILNLLREEMGFDGVIISDSLVMQGCLKGGNSIEEISIRALNAGCDLLLLGGASLQGESRSELSADDVKRVHKALVTAVCDGRVSLDRLDAAVGRVMKLKEKLQNAIEESDQPCMECLARRIAEKALTVELLRPLPKGRAAVFASIAVEKEIEKTSFANAYFLETATMDCLEKEANEADLLVLLTCNAWKNPVQKERVQKLLNKGKPLVFIALRDPLDTELALTANLVIQTFSPVAASIESAYNVYRRQL